jgi:hypothetical protein
MNNQSKLATIVIGLFLFAASSGISFLVFRTLGFGSVQKPVVTDTSVQPSGKPARGSKIDPSLPKTEECPLNGQLFTKTEADTWSSRRPLAVMIENHEESRPTSGLGSADIVYEAVAEGGITRFMGIFYCAIAAENTTLAPVRSARIYFVKLVPEYDALYNHVGGAGNCDDPTVNERAKALCYIQRNKIKDLDQFGRAGDFKTCHRLTNRLDHDVAYEHTMACFTDTLYKAAEKYNWTNVDAKGVSWDKNFSPWKFSDSKPAVPSTATTISFDFWTSQKMYSVVWKYDSASNNYLRENGGVPAIDLNYQDQLNAKNIVVQFVTESGPLDDHKHMDYGVIGTGKGLLFQNGVVQNITWSKATAASRTIFKDSQGKEISFVRGQIWIELVPSTNTVEYN